MPSKIIEPFHNQENQAYVSVMIVSSAGGGSLVILYFRASQTAHGSEFPCEASSTASKSISGVTV